MSEKKKESKIVEKLHWIADHILAILAIIIVILVFGGAYYFVIAPNLITKPFIEKPKLPEDALERISEGEEIINSSHINYLINEIGAYKLKKPFGAKDLPIMEFFVADINQRYYAYTKDHVPFTKKGNPKNEDIIITGDQKTVVEILNSDDLISEVKKARDDGRVKVELVSSMRTLAAKGYLSLYDTLK